MNRVRPSNIQKYEFLHGCVFTALLRSKKIPTACLIEADADSAMAMYKVNDSFIHIKPCTSPISHKATQSRVWQFTFSQNELRAIHANKSNVVLVCADANIKASEKMYRILIEFDSVKSLLNLDPPPAQDSLTAKHVPLSKSLFISGNGNGKSISPKALLDWVIPGS